MARAKKIAVRKQKHGHFTSIEEILELDGFGIKVLEKFCNSVLNFDESSNAIKPGTFEDSNTKKKLQFVTPILSEPLRKTITSCVAFHVDLKYIGWSKVSLSQDETIYVDEWVCHEIGNEAAKMSLSDLTEILVFLNGLIPTADVYVLESLLAPQAQKQPGSLIQMNLNIQRYQIVAMLSILMASRPTVLGQIDESKEENDERTTAQCQDAQPDKDEKKIKQKMRSFFLKNFLSSRLYKTYIGTERVSTENTIENIIYHNDSSEPPKSGPYSKIKIHQGLRYQFEDNDRIQREFMGQSLLNALAFLKICVLKCPASIEALTSRKRS